jgi:D-alanine transaminase
MTRIVYVNGEYIDETVASLSIFDRGILFADSVYEVSSVLQGKLIDNAAHLARLQISLAALDMKLPVTLEALQQIQVNLVKTNQLQEGIVYIQVTRGVSFERSFAIPQTTSSSLMVFTQAANLTHNPLAERGINVVTVEDIRWQRRDIKTTMLLPASLAKQYALTVGADDAWLVTDGYVNEGSANNAFIITQDNCIVTRPLDQQILHGITRAAVLRLAQEQALDLEERAFSVQEAYQAKEAFSTGASAFVLPVVSIDEYVLGNGKPGVLTKRLRQLYMQQALALAS